LLTAGVEVAAESVDHVGDIDEFTFAGVQDQVITVFLDNFASHSALSVLLDVIDPSTDEVLGTISTEFQTPITTEPITLPATRDYLIRVRSHVETLGKGSYRIRVD
jgi:hypothetical protein